MAIIKFDNRVSNAQAVINLMHHFMKANTGDDITISTVTAGFHLSSTDNKRFVKIEGCNIFHGGVRIEWNEHSYEGEGESYTWPRYQEKSSHNLSGVYDLAERIVEFMSRKVWPEGMARCRIN